MSDDFMAGRESDEEEPGALAHERKAAMGKVVQGEKARSGETSGHVRRILGISIAMVTILLGILLAYWMSNG
jgi:hypothetical protein